MGIDENTSNITTQNEAQVTHQTENNRTLPKSKRWWKKVQTSRPISSSTKPKSDWEKKMKEKSLHQQVRSLQVEIRQKLADERAQKQKAKKEKEERRKQNELKAEVVQHINPAKLKRMKKKQLRMIRKRDTATVDAGKP